MGCIFSRSLFGFTLHCCPSLPVSGASPQFHYSPPRSNQTNIDSAGDGPRVLLVGWGVYGHSSVFTCKNQTSAAPEDLVWRYFHDGAWFVWIGFLLPAVPSGCFPHFLPPGSNLFTSSFAVISIKLTGNDRSNPRIYLVHRVSCFYF